MGVPPEMMAQVMENPMFEQMMNNLLQNPQMMQQVNYKILLKICKNWSKIGQKSDYFR